MDRTRKTAALLCASALFCLASQPASAATTTEVVPDPTLPGLAVNGAVFISLGKGGGFARCSGTSVNAPNMSVVVTAGHCVYDEGRFYDRKWVFVPGYRYGERPFGTFSAKWLGTTPQWRASNNFNYDVGMAVVGRNERGQRLAAAVGGDDIAGASRRSRASTSTAIRSRDPSPAPPWSAACRRRCSGTTTSRSSLPGPLDLGVSCDLSPGSSGGGWVIHGNVLNGVTSNGYGDDPQTDYGPYFGKEVGRLFRRAASGRDEVRAAPPRRPGPAARGRPRHDRHGVDRQRPERAAL